MKILIVIPANKQGKKIQYSTFISTELLGLRNQGHNVTEFFFINRNSINGILSELKKLNLLIKEFQPDIIHSHYGATCGLLVMMSKRKCPWVITFGGSELLGHPNKGVYWRIRESLSIRLSHLAANKASHIICVSQNLVEKLSKINQKKCTIIPRGIDTSFFYPQRSEKKSPYILFSLPRLNATVKNLPLAEKVVSTYNKLYNQNYQLKIMNNLKQEEIRQLFNQSTMLLVTSHHEGSPNIVKEAMACNLPILSVDCGDVRFLLDNVFNSYVASSYESDELVELMKKIILSKDDSSNGSEVLKNKGLDIESCVKRINNIYYSLLK